MNELYIVFWVIWFGALLLIAAYGAVLLFGAPYFPSLSPHVKAGLDLLDLKKGQTVYDLGCGDGRFLKAAARRGIKAVGYELNPFMFAVAWFNTRRYRKLVKVRYGNFWHVDLSDADGIFIFLLTKYMKRFDKLVKTKAPKGVKVASHAFKIPGKKIVAKDYGVFLYQY
ncbi:methyltransferase domain-containing protein [Candidatus Saccharibacteria bacterium]|nr:methyltransferase domain-containing protein [Candidatus Saccharibacteria bacterium]